MKKLIEILGTITIAGSGMAGLIGNAPVPEKNEVNYLQTNNLENLNRVKRDWLDDLADLKLSQQEIDELNKVYDPATASYLPGFTESVVNTLSTNDGATFEFKWRWYKVFYWTLSMNDKACQKVLDSDESDIIIAIEGILSGVGGFAALVPAAVVAVPTLPATAVGIGIAGAATYLNSVAIKKIIKSNNNGNGVWIGFWLNQPGIGWGSL